MRIAYFTDTYEPQINGVVTSIRTFAENLRSRGHEVYIFCPSGSKRSKYNYTISSKSFKNYPEYRMSFPSFDVLSKIVDINPDIIHVHTPVTIGVAGLCIAKLLKIPVVVTYHTQLKDYIGYITQDKTGGEFIEVYTKWFFKRFPMIIVPSKPIRRFLRKNGIKKPIKVLPTPMDVGIIGRDSERKNKVLTILHVGRLCKEKRIDIVLEAFSNVLDKEDSKLIITSGGPDEKRLRDIAKRLGIEKKVEFTEYVSVGKLKKLYSSADVFVSASDTETQGIVVLEAMANGCPVIVRDSLGFKDIVKNGKNGLLFKNSRELSEKIIKLSKNKKLRKKLIKEGLKTAKSLGSENYIQKLEGIYEDNLNSKEKKLLDRIFYAYLLFSNFLLYWFINKINLTISSRIINFYLRSLTGMIKFETSVERHIK